MPITKRQRKQRANYLGASDVARCIARGEAHLVVAEKLGAEGVQPNEAMALGTALEKPLVQWTAARVAEIDSRAGNGCRLRMNVEQSIRRSPITLHIDGLIERKSCPVAPIEVKTAGLAGPLPEGWGAPGSADIPMYAMVQIQLACHATGTKTGYVGAWLPSGRSLYVVAYDPSYAKKLVEYARRLWAEYVVPRRLPPLDATDIDRWAALRKPMLTLPREAGGALVLSEPEASEWRQVAAAYESLREAARINGKLADALQARMLSRVGEYSAMDLGRGVGVRVRRVSRRAHTREVPAGTYTKMSITHANGYAKGWSNGAGEIRSEDVEYES